MAGEWFNQPVGGYSASPGPQGGDGLEMGPSSTDTLYPNSQMTWGQFVNLLGSGGSAQQFGGQETMQNPFAQYMQRGQQGQGPRIYKIGPTADYNRPEPEKGNTGIGEVMQIAGMFFGI